MTGLGLDEARELRPESIAEELQLSEEKFHGAELAVEAVRSAIDDLRRKGV